jgi:membrane dipeptidase
MKKLIDLHCDTISLIHRTGGGLYKNNLHVDIQKLMSAGSLAQFFAIFLPTEETESPLTLCKAMIDTFYAELELNREYIAFAGSCSDIKRNGEQGKISAFLTIEDSGIIGGSIQNLNAMYALGVRLITLSWNYKNQVASPNCTAELSREGLAPGGMDFVREMNRLGVIVDVSHLSDAGFYDVVRCCRAPFVASHSNSRSVTSHFRNLTDDMIRLLAQNGGVTGLNFCGLFLERYQTDVYTQQREKGAAVSDVISHAKHIVNVGGIDCLAIGSDFDGITSVPRGLEDMSQMTALYDALEIAGFTGGEIDKITYKNALRVISEVCK